MKYKGSCHCGKIQFETEGELTEAMECNCSICRRRGYLLWFVPLAKFRLLTPQANISTYQFNKKLINHNFCPTCGCAPFGTGSDGKGHEMAAINVRCLDDLSISGLKINFYDGKSL
jgi:hypothetical protein